MTSLGWRPDELTLTEWYIPEMGRDLPHYRRAGYGSVVFYATRTVNNIRAGHCYTVKQPSTWHILRVPLPHCIADLEASVLRFLTHEVGVLRQDFARDITAAVLPYRARGLAGDSVMREEFSVGVNLQLLLERLDEVSKWLRAETFGVAAAGLEGKTCCICLDDLRPGDQLRGLPCCTHVFHSPCIVPWVVQRARPTCPYCRRTAFNSSEKKAIFF